MLHAAVLAVCRWVCSEQSSDLTRLLVQACIFCLQVAVQRTVVRPGTLQR